jgi:2-methylaconitate cis-trans-isomerase PrpF
MRGGTSKGIFFHENELPHDSEEKTKLLLRVMGSPDKRQIDGLGGADILTSKVVIIAPPSRSDAHLDFVFGQVGISEPTIDFGTLCGNLSSAVGPFAIDEGLVRATGEITRVRIFCPMVNRYLESEVPTQKGKTYYDGSFTIAGVPGTASRITLDFSDTAGLLTGNFLPTGRVRDDLSLSDYGQVSVTVVDAGTVVAFVKGSDFGLTGAESPEEMEADDRLIRNLEKLRITVADWVGMAGKSPLMPMVAIVCPPLDYRNFLTGETIKADKVHLVSKVYAAGMMHKAYPVTGAVATGAAALLQGGTVNECLSQLETLPEKLVLGHFSGQLPVEVTGEQREDGFELSKAGIYRTARRIMEGFVFF